MRNILNKIYLHPLFLITVLVFILIGRFKFVLCFMILIIIHELGHITISLIYKWKIDKVVILPFGGLIKYNNYINTPLKEEFLVSISGIIFQLVGYMFLKKYVNYEYFHLINYFIIVFNLLPIYPLDGSKMLNVIFNFLIGYKKSLILTIIVSYIFILLSLIVLNFNKLIVLVVIFLLIETIKLYKIKSLLFNKFLLERYLNNFKFKNKKIIKQVSQMKKDYKHLFLINGMYYTEDEILKNIFI